MTFENEILQVAKLGHQTATQKISDINSKILSLQERREYQKGIRDATYEVISMMKAHMTQEERVEEK